MRPVFHEMPGIDSQSGKIMVNRPLTGPEETAGMTRSLRLIIVLLAIAGVAEAQQTSRPPASAAATLGLRGAVTQENPVERPATNGQRAQAREPVAYGARGAIPPLTVAAPGAGDVAQQCRLACAQAYYICLSGGQADDCPTSWSQCRAGCNSDPLPSSY